MPLDLSAGSLIRSGSGLLYLGAGIALALLARRGVGDTNLARALAVHCAGFGAAFIVFNLGARDPVLAPWFVGASAIAWMFALLGVLWALVCLRPTRGRAAYYALAIGAAAIASAFLVPVAAALAARSGLPSSSSFAFAITVPIVFTSAAAVFTIAIELAVAYRREDAHRRRGLALFAIGLVLYPAFIAAENSAGELRGLGLGWQLVSLALLGASVASWLAATGRTPGPARYVAWAILAAALTSMVSSAFLGVDDLGLVGIVRVVAFVALATAILRYDLLRADLKLSAVRRGSLAAGALALLFIVAQIGQNFLSAQFGLLTGGIVAGVFLFAAAPIQRAIERASAQGQAQGQAQAKGSDRARREEVYLNAARLAMRDRRLTRAEEAHLHALAEELGLGAKRAHELLVQAEVEAGVAGT